MKRLSEIENFTARLTCHESELRWITWRVLRAHGTQCDIKEVDNIINFSALKLRRPFVLLPQYWNIISAMKQRDGENKSEYLIRIRAGKKRGKLSNYRRELIELQMSYFEIAEALNKPI